MKNEQTQTNKTLVLVAGASGSLGRSYINNLRIDNVEIYGISRKKILADFPCLYADLLDKNKLTDQLNTIPFTEYSTVVYIHTVGKFKFEISGGGKDIDQDVYESNVTTFENIKNILLKKIPHKTNIVFCCFGSISDRYHVPYWKSYTQAKNQLRAVMKNVSTLSHVRSVFINVSTVDTGNENKLRPYAEKSFWLAPDKIVRESMETILFGTQDYAEFDIFEPHPDFSKKYYSDHQAILKKWTTELGS